MTADPTSYFSPPVRPVIDYEPPARAISHNPSSARPRQPGTPSRPVPAHRPPPAALPAGLRPIAAFADNALRRVLEVVDGRRAAAHLHQLLAPELVDSVRSAGTAGAAPAAGAGAAVLQRVRVQPHGPDDPPTAAEVFGTYRRGHRVHALACRIQRTPGASGPGWQVIALHIG